MISYILCGAVWCGAVRCGARASLLAIIQVRKVALAKAHILPIPLHILATTGPNVYGICLAPDFYLHM